MSAIGQVSCDLTVGYIWVCTGSRINCIGEELRRYARFQCILGSLSSWRVLDLSNIMPQVKLICIELKLTGTAKKFQNSGGRKHMRLWTPILASISTSLHLPCLTVWFCLGHILEGYSLALQHQQLSSSHWWSASTTKSPLSFNLAEGVKLVYKLY